MTKADFGKWEFLLKGNPMTLRGYSTNHVGLYLNIYGGVNHYLDCPDDDFRMTSIYCEGETDENVIWQIGYELLSLFNGAHRLVDREFRKVELETVWRNGEDLTYRHRQSLNELLGKPQLSDKEIAEQLEHAKKGSQLITLVHFATENDDARLLLKYFDLEESWVNYYKILETVESFSKMHSIVVDIDGLARTRFKNTSNSYSLAGINSRHGFKAAVKANNTPSMTIEEAYKFVSSATKEYLLKRYFK